MTTMTQNNRRVFRRPVKVVATAGCSSRSPRRAGAERLVSLDGFLPPHMRACFRRPGGEGRCVAVSQSPPLPTPV